MLWQEREYDNDSLLQASSMQIDLGSVPFLFKMYFRTNEFDTFQLPK